MTGSRMRRPATRAFVWTLVLGAALGFVLDAARLPLHESHSARFQFLVVVKAAKWTAIAWSSFLVFLAVQMRWRHLMLYRGVRRQRSLLARRLQRHTRIDRFILPGLVWPALLTVAASVLYFRTGVTDLLFLPSVITARVLWVLVRFREFPALLFLTSSANPEKIYNHYDLKMFISPFRVATMLDYSSAIEVNHPGSGSLYPAICLDVFRTGEGSDWRRILHQLMEYVPVIVVDGRAVTEHTAYEAAYVFAKGLDFKTLFVVDQKGASPLLEQVPASLGRAFTCAYGDLFRYLKLVYYDRSVPSAQRPLHTFDVGNIGEPDFHFKSTTAEYYCAKGNAALARRDFARAETEYQAALAATPQHHESLWTNLAIVALNRAEPELALSRIRKALAENPRHPNAVLTAGMIHELGGEWTEALGRFKEFLEMARPGDVARIRYARSRIGRIEMDLRSQISGNPFQPVVMECPTTKKTFRLPFNSSMLAEGATGRVKCPCCGDTHDCHPSQVRVVSHQEAQKYPR